MAGDLLKRAPRLPTSFPFRSQMQGFLTTYASTESYWYVPKARTLSDDNALAIADVLGILETEFADRPWNRETQHDLLQRMIQLGIVVPTGHEATDNDANALIRIWKVLLQFLGLVWLDEGTEQIVLTAAGSVLTNKSATAARRRAAIETQLAKYQYPNPALNAPYREDFKGLLPLLFLLQVMQATGYRLTHTEYNLFVNLAQSHGDLSKIVGYIKAWRDLAVEEQDTVMALVRRIATPRSNVSRENRVRLNSSYQLAAFTYPLYLALEQIDGDVTIVCTAPRELDEVVQNRVTDMKALEFSSIEEWVAYYGDPEQQPDWSTYLLDAIDKAESEVEAKRIVREARRLEGKHISRKDIAEIEKKQVEKAIEDFYEKQLGLIEAGLTLVEDGRQYQTPIGRMDLLCWGADNMYVVVEIKVGEAEDAVFGQVLRYMGWIHRNIDEGAGNVRSIVVAGAFGETARYSRIGLLVDDYKERISFYKHGFAGSVI